METLVSEHQLENLLDKEIYLTKRLQQILEAEKQALAERNPELLQALATEKLQALYDIESNHKQNIKLSSGNTSLDQSAEEFRWEKLIHNIKNPKDALLKKCESYKHLLGEVEYLNSVNAKTASRMQHSISELIKIIRGSGQSQKLYTPKGGAAINNTYTSIAKA